MQLFLLVSCRTRLFYVNIWMCEPVCIATLSSKLQCYNNNNIRTRNVRMVEKIESEPRFESWLKLKWNLFLLHVVCVLQLLVVITCSYPLCWPTKCRTWLLSIVLKLTQSFANSLCQTCFCLSALELHLLEELSPTASHLTGWAHGITDRCLLTRLAQIITTTPWAKKTLTFLFHCIFD